MSEKSPWNSLEVAKIIATISLPLAVALFGFFTQRVLKESEFRARASESLARKRQEVYDQIGVSLNNIYCYIEEVGSYKNFTPDTLMEDRRMVHRIMHKNRVYWSAHTFELYLRYMDDTAFSTWEAGATDAKIRARPGQKANLPSWKVDWVERFTAPDPARPVPHPEHRQRYLELIRAISRDLGVTEPG